MICWIASYPKSGNTWFRLFLRNYLQNDAEPCNFNHTPTQFSIASLREYFDRYSGLESSLLTYQEVAQLKAEVFAHRARLCVEDLYLKTHEPCTAVARAGADSGTKLAVYLLRNPLDVALSFSDHMGCDIDKTINLMGNSNCVLNGMKDERNNQLRQTLSSWSENVCSWADNPGFPVLVLKYEEMKANPLDAFGEAIQFFGLPFDAQRLDKAIRFSQFNELKKQEQAKGFNGKSPHSSNGFFRKGEAGQWHKVLTPAQVLRIVKDHGVVMKRFGYLGGIAPDILKEIDL